MSEFKHPEQLEDEVYLTNASDDIDEPCGLDDIFREALSSYDQIGWTTKRKGRIAYDIHGEPLGNRWEGSFPVFVKIEEIRECKDGEEILEWILSRS